MDIQQPAAAPQSKLGSEVYTGVAAFGRFQAVIGAIVGVIIAIILIIIGSMRLRDKHTASALMKITSVKQCTQQTQTDNQGNTSVNYACTIAVSFTASNGKTYSNPSVSVISTKPLSTGMAITLRYDPSSPSSIVQEASPKALGWGLIGGGILIGGLAIGAAVLSFKSKGFAAVEGTAGLIGAFRR